MKPVPPEAVFDALAEEHYARALKLVSERQTFAAEREFRAAWERNPNENKYVHGLAVFYIHHGRIKEGLEVIKDHVKRHGPTDLGYTLQGELLFVQKRYDLAYESLQRALELSYKENYRAHQLVGLIYVIKRRYNDALQELRIAAQQNPDGAQVRYFYGRACYQTGHYCDARDEFLECLRLQPEYPRALENLGLCYEALQDNSKAIEAYQQAIKLEKAGKIRPSEDPYVNYGALLAARGYTNQALVLLRDALQKNPNSARGNFELGRLLFRTGEYDRAEKSLLRSATLDPNFSRPHYFLGRIYQSRKRAEDAKLQFSIFEKLNAVPENREAAITGRTPWSIE